MANRWHLPVIVALFVLMAGVYSVVTPLFEAPMKCGITAMSIGRRKRSGHAGQDGWPGTLGAGRQPAAALLPIGRAADRPLPPGDWATSVRYNPHAPWETPTVSATAITCCTAHGMPGRGAALRFLRTWRGYARSCLARSRWCLPT